MAVLPTGDGFLIGLPFTEHADWCQNMLAGGGGVIRWRRSDYAVVTPRVIDRASAARALGPRLRIVIRISGSARFLQLTRSPLPRG